MKQYVCDRCEKTYSPSEQFKQRVHVRNMHGKLLLEVGFDTLDLCPRCSNELVLWLRQVNPENYPEASQT